MKQYFYAYHGPDNGADFDPVGGYGVSQEYKQKQTKIGDWVYVIQKRPKRDFYELCGSFEITKFYYDEISKRPYRFRLIEANPLLQRIAIDEDKCSRQLPPADGPESWSNFQRHFCRQGVSFQSPLESKVVAVLDKLIRQSSGIDVNPTFELKALEVQFDEDVSRSAKSSSAERLNRLASADRIPRLVQVLTKKFMRNPDVVAESLYRAGGSCEKCGKEAPFARRTDGSPYLEVHHKVLLADGGEDALGNTIALCPDCHRELHFGV